MSEVQRLRDRVEELEGLLGIGRDDVAAYRYAFDLTHTEAKFLGLLARRPGIVSPDDAIAAIYGDPDGGPDPKMLSVVVCKLRKPLREIVVEIRTDWGAGYFIPATDKKKLRAHVQACRRNDQT